MAWPISLFSGSVNTKTNTSEHESESTEREQFPSEPVAELLKYFEAPGVAPPPSSRVGDLKLKQREYRPLRPWQLWQHATFIVSKASGLFAAAISHHLHGPPRKSWGLQMTLLASIMRDISRYSYLADLTLIRMLMGISGLIPVPSDAIITPVTFEVPCRRLRGILEDFDAAENGTRELSGEWVVGKKTWRRLQSEWLANKNAREDTDGLNRPQKRKERVILFIHGGAYYVSSPATHRLLTIPLAKVLDARLFALDYRLAPETRFPGPLHDAVSAYFRLTDDLHIPAENIIIAGDSAGGGLSVALLMYLRDNGYPLPGGGILMSPWVDLTMSCDSWESNAQYDIVPKPVPGDHLNPIQCYLGEHMEKYLTHPYASPLFGDFKGLPPLLIQSGDSEVLRDESTLMAHKAAVAGVNVRHELYEDAVHVFQAIPFLEHAQQAFYSARTFVLETLKPIEGDVPRKFERKVEVRLEQEINTEKAKVVQGDGSDSLSKKDELYNPERMSETRVARPDSHGADSEEGSSSQEEDPSWVSPSPWPSPPLSPDKSDEKDFQFPRPKTAGSNSSSQGPRSHASSITNPFLRMPSMTFPKTPLISPPTPTPTNPSGLPSTSPRRLPSRTYLNPTEAPTHPPGRVHRHSTTNSTTVLNMTAPRPSIRRSHSSHPDITMLCEQWAYSGPANQTLMFRPDAILNTLPKQRKKSGSVSSAGHMFMRGPDS
ncbi:hypothetical protein BDW22DRAFT_1435947 [Trametopsis cervina]|nr:hypothetical protein BDW22DRAFT_1435947 [Trametopsis cervina]